MRTLNPTLALASVVGFLLAASCTLITDVDRTKIPNDAGAEGGSPGTGGSGGSGGKGGSAGKGGTSGDAGGSTGGTAGTGVVTAECAHAEGSITLSPGVLLADGDTFTIGDGINPSVTFEFDLDTAAGLNGPNNKGIDFDGTENNFGLAVIIADAINAQGDNLRVAAANIATAVSGSGGAAGAAGGGLGGAGTGAGGAPNAAGGAPEGGSGGVVSPGDARVELSNELAGHLGNKTITKKIGNPAFKVSGMSGGKSVACQFDSSCTDGAECDSGECGDDKLCVQSVQ